VPFRSVFHFQRVRPITIQLVGGLGNQLFGYFAGVYWSRANNGCVRFVRSSQEAHSSMTNSSILDFEFAREKFVPNTFLTRALSLVLRYASSLRVRLVSARQLFSNLFPAPYLSSNTGFDPNFSFLPAGTFVEGYFQTYRYFSDLRLQGLYSEICVKKPSDWYLDTMKAAEVERPIIVHIRRGDYKALSSSIGLIGSQYYAKALEIARKVSPNSSVWVFTDDPQAVGEEFPKDTLLNAVWIKSPSEATAAEVMLLMSMGSVIVVSNSTFSWWAATLGSPKKVVAPKEWFRVGDEPEDLIPRDWIRVPSHWE